MTKRPSHQSGTTLMELIVYLAISSVVILSMTTFVSALTKTRVQMSDQQVAQSEARNIVERLTYAIRNSKDVTVSGNRVDITNETGLVTSYCGCDGTIKVGEQVGFPPAEADLQPTLDQTITIDTLTLTRISSALHIVMILEKAGQRAEIESTIAFRQTP